MTLSYRVESTTSPRQRIRDPLLIASSDALRRAFSETVNKLRNLRTWQQGWNGYDAAAPKREAIRRAMVWIAAMYEDALATTGEWHTPHVAANEDGDVLFEWWNEDKALTVYVSEDTARYIKGWGLNIDTDMEDGEATRHGRRQDLWEWLLN
jgi:hypothetical protein